MKAAVEESRHFQLFPPFLHKTPHIYMQTANQPHFFAFINAQKISLRVKGKVTSMSRHPIVKWAQRSDKLFVTVELPDAKNVKLKLEPEGKFVFSATAGADNVPYEVDLDLFDKIDVDESKASSTSRSIVYLVKKAENKWWSRLIKQEGVRPVFLKVDWDKWVDEDEEDSKPATDMDYGDMDFSKLNMGGMGGPSDFDDDVPEGDDDSDTEEEVKEEENSAHSEPKPAAPSRTEPEAKA